MLKSLSSDDRVVNKINYINDDPVVQTQYNHPYYANMTSYPADTHVIQPRCPSLPTPSHNQFSFDDLMRNSQMAGNYVLQNYLPSSLAAFFTQMVEVLGGLIQDLMRINRYYNLEQVVAIFMAENRLFYLGVLCLVLFAIRYVVKSIFENRRSN